MWHKLKAYRWSWLGVAVWLLLGLLGGVFIEQWYQDNFGDDGNEQESSWVVQI